MPCARIDSYFSLPTDLAAQARSWPEFVQGSEYSVDFANEDDAVTVRLVPQADDDCDHIVVRARHESRLFHAVLGFVSFALAAHSDNVQVSKWVRFE